jgi:hypothetical protein
MTNDLDMWKDAETPAVVDALDQLGSGRTGA